MELVHKHVYLHSPRDFNLKTKYPLTYASIKRWAQDNEFSVTEANTRYAQYAILRAITSSRALREALVFKGGNALDFIWQPNRSTQDLDFSIDLMTFQGSIDEDRLRSLLQGGIERIKQDFNLMLQVGRIDRQPPGADKIFVTFKARIRYALPNKRQYQMMQHDSNYNSPTMIPVEISIYEPICGTIYVDIDGDYPLRVSTIEDIVAEKLRALLQQPIRKRGRRQDLLDIAVIVTGDAELDLALVKEYLLRKAEAIDVPVSREAFYNPDIMIRASRDYGALSTSVRTRFISFNEAKGLVLRLVDSLELPKSSDTEMLITNTDSEPHD